MKIQNVQVCGICEIQGSKPALKLNSVHIGHCCLGFIANLAKCNKNTLWQELENQINYVSKKSLNKLSES